MSKFCFIVCEKIAQTLPGYCTALGRALALGSLASNVLDVCLAKKFPPNEHVALLKRSFCGVFLGVKREVVLGCDTGLTRPL